MTWSAERMTGVWPAKHWRLSQGDRVLVVTGEDGDVMHVVEALNAYDPRPCLASMGVHDCVRPQGHEGAHACDDECNRGHLRLRDVAALASTEAVEA